MTCGVIGVRAPRSARVRVVLSTVVLTIAVFCCPASTSAAEAPSATTSAIHAPVAAKVEIFDVADVRQGMQGNGRTVLAGTELVEFQATVLGVLRNVKPGQDLVLCRLAGAGLEYTGVVAGMSGSPVYLDGKLLGAVAYTWQFNKEPIAGVTPFAQMRSFAAHRTPPASVAATAAGAAPLALLDLTRDPSAAIEPLRASAMVATGQGNDALEPVAVPLSAAGFGPRTLAELSARLGPMGMTPMAAGAVTSEILDRHGRERLEPGSPMAVSLISGDFDLSGMGTTTHVEGDRVWGWGHPFLGTGACDYVLRGGYIHLVNPKSDLSTKIGSPLASLGVVQADVSTCIAGRIGAEPDLVPVDMTLRFADQGETQRYQVRIVRHPQLLGSLLPPCCRTCWKAPAPSSRRSPSKSMPRSAPLGSSRSWSTTSTAACTCRARPARWAC